MSEKVSIRQLGISRKRRQKSRKGEKKKEKRRSTRELLQSILTVERRNTQNAKNGFPTVGTILETMEFSV